MGIFHQFFAFINYIDAKFISCNQVSVRAAARLINAYLIDNSLVTPENRGLLLDDNKLYNSTLKMGKVQLAKRDERIQNGVSAVYFDSRIDKTAISKVVGGNFSKKDQVEMEKGISEQSF